MAAYNAVLILAVIIFYQEFRKEIKSGNKDFVVATKNSIKVIGQGLIGGSRNMVSVALATASAGIIVGVVGMGIGGMITQIVETLAQGNIFLLLLITAIASLLLGMGLPTTATYIVMASLTAPIIVNLGASYGFFLSHLWQHIFSVSTLVFWRTIRLRWGWHLMPLLLLQIRRLLRQVYRASCTTCVQQ